MIKEYHANLWIKRNYAVAVLQQIGGKSTTFPQRVQRPRKKTYILAETSFDGYPPSGKAKAVKGKGQPEGKKLRNIFPAEL